MTAPRIRFLYIDYILNELLKQMKVSFGTNIEHPFYEGARSDYQYFEGGA